MKLTTLLIAAVLLAYLATADGACYRRASRSARIIRYRYERQKYSYRTFWFGWVRKSAYRSNRVAYYVATTQYYNEEIPCPVHGGWTDWSAGHCTVSCGRGIRSYTRTCTNPRPANGGRRCVGSSYKVDNCDQRCCPVHGGWSSWVTGTCSSTCGGGVKNVTRDCNNPRPQCGGKNCEGISFNTSPCSENCCPIDGVWSEWIDFGNCSRQCGGGAQEQFRSCDSPTPSCGGRACTGPRTQVIGCNPQCCPVHGGWTVWEDVTQCSDSCGGGLKQQVRSCTNPVSQCGGDECVGEEYRNIPCNTQCCPVDGGWSEWEDISPCSKTCGGGYKLQNRSCTAPSFSCGGTPCVGSDHRTELCNMGCCPVDGEWSEWEEVTECSADCGGGIVTKWRNCSDPSPSCGGRHCQGDDITNASCNTHCCPVDGGWSKWIIGNCSVECGGGIKEKFRTCSDPPSTCGGKECSGNKVERMECNEHPCKDVYGDWGNFSECSVTCGKGIKFRTRSCAGECKDPTTEYEDCDMGCCPVDGGWTDWVADDSPCSVTCGDGKQSYSRSCTNPEPACGGKNCTGSATQTKECTLPSCPLQETDLSFADIKNLEG